MGECYYIGKRRKRKKHRWIFRAALLLLGAIAFCHFSLYPHIEALAEAETQTHIERLFNEKLGEVLLSGEFESDPLVAMSHTADGRVASVTVDTVRLNLLKYRVAAAVLAEIGARDVSLTLPVSSLFGVILFSGINGGLPVKIRTAEKLTARFATDFEESGINQTLYTLSFALDIGITCLLPSGIHRATVSCAAPVCELLIVGEVPDSFTDINRLTDDVTEYDIDDAVDFGSVLD